MNALIKIIIVDDHQMVRETWKLLLQQDNRFKVIAECSGGAEAILLAQNLKPDIILMDINMSPVNGFEATRHITQLAPTVKIIGLSNNIQPGYARNLIRLGAKGYVTKNSSREEMYKAIIEIQNGKTYVCEEIKSIMLMKDDEQKDFPGS